MDDQPTDARETSSRDTSSRETSSREDARVVIVLGPGRSGTSSIAGALSMSGVAVPGPAISADDSNPRGHFEPSWMVGLQHRILTEARVGDLDPTPRIADRLRPYAQGEVRAEVRAWIGSALDEHDQVVLKDPRTVHFVDLWTEACDDLGVKPRFLTMLRHPAEVSGSRNTYYFQVTDPAERRAGAIRQVAGWLNAALEAERASRSYDRVFVRYQDLLADWRPELTRVADQLDLRLQPPADASPHPVEDFIDPGLRRVTVSWDDLDVPVALADLAQRTWDAFEPLTTGADGDPAAFDRLREDYDRYFTDALDLTQAARKAGERAARAAGAERARQGAEKAATRARREAESRTVRARLRAAARRIRS
ncbi:hypothetical protein CLV56_2591 [Mumia flava]|uniref:Sulfotransferase family protein n=1 Tax=Mumia flava TaxID=1348852 RepID=A0A0B2BAX8_9ACTN|nr:sulfotransferase [Mumia flava]PJJ58340.1 hypothetical protein CLV56_2591 [Mumia flava]